VGGGGLVGRIECGVGGGYVGSLELAEKVVDLY